MKRILLFASALFMGANGMAQVADFEETLPTATDTAWFGQDQTLTNTSTFVSGDFKFENTYTIATWGSYSTGCSYSNITDNTTTGSGNQYSNITGSGDASTQYGIVNVTDKDRVFATNNMPFSPTSIKITNNTYTYLSMLNGDAFAVQFGDVSNPSGGEDSLVLSIYGLDANMQRTDSIIVYLADFTNGNSFLMNTWTTVNLTSLGSVYGLDFGLISSDNGTFGMNTPAYFAMDNLQAVGMVDADFEVLALGAETAWYGQDNTLSGYFTFVSGFYEFENNYNIAPWGSYSQAWSFSNYTDVTTAGSSNQYSAYTGAGESSNQYGVCNVSPYNNNRLFSTSKVAFTPSGAYFTNTTYAALSMLNGDSFGTQFGDVNNTAGGEDWFLLTIYGLAQDSTRTGDSVIFYLADYRSADNTQDYIVDAWTWVDLSSLGEVYGVDFELSSSDTNSFGMLTPAYFAMDKFGGTVTGIESNQTAEMEVYPNPTNGNLNIEVNKNSMVSLFDLNGRLVMTEKAKSDIINWDISDLENGIYILTTETNGTIYSQKVVKK